MQDEYLSRTGVQSPIGPLTEELATKVDRDTMERFRQMCARGGTNSSAQLRNYVCKVVHGKTFDVLVAEASYRSQLMLGMEGPNEGLMGNQHERGDRECAG